MLRSTVLHGRLRSFRFCLRGQLGETFPLTGSWQRLGPLSSRFGIGRCRLGLSPASAGAIIPKQVESLGVDTAQVQVDVSILVSSGATSAAVFARGSGGGRRTSDEPDKGRQKRKTEGIMVTRRDSEGIQKDKELGLI